MLYYIDLIQKQKQKNQSDQAIIEFYNLSFINDRFLKEIDRLEYAANFRHRKFRNVCTGFKPGSVNEHTHNLILAHGGIDKFYQLLSTVTESEIAKLLGCTRNNIRDYLRRHEPRPPRPDIKCLGKHRSHKVVIKPRNRKSKVTKEMRELKNLF
jgi:hypothetical protein